MPLVLGELHEASESSGDLRSDTLNNVL